MPDRRSLWPFIGPEDHIAIFVPAGFRSGASSRIKPLAPLRRFGDQIVAGIFQHENQPCLGLIEINSRYDRIGSIAAYLSPIIAKAGSSPRASWVSGELHGVMIATAP